MGGGDTAQCLYPGMAAYSDDRPVYRIKIATTQARKTSTQSRTIKKPVIRLKIDLLAIQVARKSALLQGE
jgi:hypothetical protein